MAPSSFPLAFSERRLIPLKGGANFRDLGGYRTQGGRCVKWGRVFRSGGLSGLTEADHATLAQLSIRTVCDLRTSYEREAEPNTWCGKENIAYWTFDSDRSLGDLGRLIASGSLTEESARTAMIGIYRQLPFEQAPAYRELLSRLAADETPLVFNCSAGKDRTGVAAALILGVLDVPAPTVIEDYLLTNDSLNASGFLGERISRYGGLLGVQAGAIAAVMNANTAYLDAALGAIRDRHGTVDAYVSSELGLSDTTLQLVRSHLLD